MIDRWIALWARTEHPRSLALVRIGLGLALLFDLVEVWRLDLVLPLFAPQELGGLSDAGTRPVIPFSLLPNAPWVYELQFAVMLVCALLVALGAFTRSASLTLLLLYAAQAAMVPEANRAVDVLARNLLAVLVLSGAGRTLSLEAWWRHGDLRAAEPIGAWSRYLVIGQLVLMYGSAGLQKLGPDWLPTGDFGALFVILQDPAIARYRFGWLSQQPFWLMTQAGTAVTLVWQLGYPLVLLWLYYRATADRPGRLRAIANRYHFDAVWVGVGVVFHVALAATTELGIFPWVMLAAYPAFLAPSDSTSSRVG